MNTPNNKNPYDELGALIAECGGNEADLLRAKDLMLDNRVSAYKDGFNEGKAYALKNNKPLPWWALVCIGFGASAVFDALLTLGGWM